MVARWLGTLTMANSAPATPISAGEFDIQRAPTPPPLPFARKVDYPVVILPHRRGWIARRVLKGRKRGGAVGRSPHEAWARLIETQPATSLRDVSAGDGSYACIVCAEPNAMIGTVVKGGIQILWRCDQHAPTYRKRDSD
jgi:hypothetical protein